MTKEKIPSAYQVKIYDEYTNTNHNIIVEAGPGSGKSHTILGMLNITPKFKSCILVAFNKSIKEELEKKVSSNVEVKTIHGLSFYILRKHIFRHFKVNEYKNFILGRKVLNLEGVKNKDSYLFVISKMIDLYRLNLCQGKEDMEAVCDQYNISTINGEVADTLKMIEYLDRYNNSDHKELMIDFTDMLWLTYSMVKPEDYPQYNVVFCDELQDLNKLQKAIVERIISRKNGRFIGVGDKRQSIYSFMGANIQAFESFANRPNTVSLPLSVTYRCSKAVTKAANKIFPGLESFEDNVEGEVREGHISEAVEGDFIICRNNMPLIESWLELVKSGKKCSILGKDFGNSLLVLISKLSKYSDYNEGIKDILDHKEKQLKDKGIKNPKGTNNYESLVEKLTIIDTLKKEFGSFETMKIKVEGIFTDEDNTRGIVLMTGHKSKGLETHTVYFLKPELIPSKYAESIQELYQEKCLEYVIITRAKVNLVYVE